MREAVTILMSPTKYTPQTNSEKINNFQLVFSKQTGPEEAAAEKLLSTHFHIYMVMRVQPISDVCGACAQNH